MIKPLIMITRVYALPMSIFSWLVAFAYGLSQSGNIIYGIIALFGICFAHLGANMFDDYIDYNTLKRVDENGNVFLVNAQQGKCEYLLNKTITPNQLLLFSLLCFGLAVCVGIFFISKIGISIFIIMLLSGLAGILYPIAGKFRLCEILIALIYGPLLFGGVSCVMNRVYDWKTLIVCLPTMLLTVNLLYTDTMLDYDLDKSENKKTIANMFSRKNSLNCHKLLLILVYLSLFLVYLSINTIGIFITLITIPMAINLISSMKLYIDDKTKLPKRRFYEGPMENWDIILNEGSASFMIRMYQARNLMIFFSIIYSATLILGY